MMINYFEVGGQSVCWRRQRLSRTVCRCKVYVDRSWGPDWLSHFGP